MKVESDLASFVQNGGKTDGVGDDSNNIMWNYHLDWWVNGEADGPNGVWYKQTSNLYALAAQITGSAILFCLCDALHLELSRSFRLMIPRTSEVYYRFKLYALAPVYRPTCPAPTEATAATAADGGGVKRSAVWMELTPRPRTS